MHSVSRLEVLYSFSVWPYSPLSGCRAALPTSQGLQTTPAPQIIHVLSVQLNIQIAHCRVAQICSVPVTAGTYLFGKPVAPTALAWHTFVPL